MKYGTTVSPYTFMWGDKDFENLTEIGFLYGDYNLSNTEDILYKLDEIELKKAVLIEKDKAHKSGFTIWQTHGPWRWPSKDFSNEDIAERFEKMSKSLYITHLLGAKLWVIHPIMPFGVDEKNTETATLTRQKNLDFFSRLLPIAKKYGITICLENMPFTNFSLSTPSEILSLVKEINDDNFKICFDTGHAAIFSGSAIGDDVRHLGNYIKALHVHDNDGKQDFHQIPYFGIIDFFDFKKALCEIEFDGVFSLETAAPTSLPKDLFYDMSKLIFETIKR